MKSNFLSKKEIEDKIKRYAECFNEIEKEASNNQPDVKKIKELSDEGKKITTLIKSISLNPGCIRKRKG